VATIDSSGHNIGEVIRQHGALTTREVLALIHEACRDSAPAFPSAAGDLWITDTGELLIARSDQAAAALDPRSGVAALLEEMLPPEGERDPARQVPAALRGLPARLRATTEGAGPRDRRDLMSILSWHLAADPRVVIEELAQRIGHPQPPAPVDVPPPQPEAMPAADDELDLFPQAETISDPPPPHPRSRSRLMTALAMLGAILLLIGIGSASYWFFRNDDAGETSSRTATAPAAPVAPVAPAAPVAPVAPAIPLALDIRDGSFSPAFAATGRELFFHAGRENGRLLVANLDDRGEVSRVSAVPSDGARDYHPRISPDGQWIAFDSDRDGERGVYVVRRDGASLQRISGSGYAAVPSWSPDMKWLAFVRGEANRPRVWNLWLRNVETGAMQRHTSHRSGQVWGASWFPGGRSLAYSHDEHLIISHLDGRGDTVIDSPIRGRLVRTPAVSPDGKLVVFQVFKDGVWLYDVQSRTTRRILDDSTAEEFA
jgi:hypothetical protein